MKLKDFEEITNAIYCAMDSSKLLGICKMWLSQLNIAWTHVEQLTSKSSFTGFFFCRGLVFVYSGLACENVFCL